VNLPQASLGQIRIGNGGWRARKSDWAATPGLSKQNQSQNGSLGEFVTICANRSPYRSKLTVDEFSNS
jgi:hypothetical protein